MTGFTVVGVIDSLLICCSVLFVSFDLLKMLRKSKNKISQMVFLHGDESHGTIRKTPLQTNPSFVVVIFSLVGGFNPSEKY